MQGPSKLPSITEFTRGLVTNRNQVASPFFTLPTGAKLQAHDLLSDGLNTEVTNNATIQRRAGWRLFSNNTAVNSFAFKDLNGTITNYQDTGVSLNQGANTVFSYSSGARAPLSMQTRGNFAYVSTAVDLKRIQNTAPTSALPWGMSTPQVRPVLGLDSLGFFNAVTGFIPSADAIAGVLTVTDGTNSRILTITVNTSSVHFNVTYSGNLISQNNSFTQITTETVVTGPPKVTTDVVTNTSGYTATITAAGISNGVMNYFPNNGISTLDFDVAFGGTMTIPALASMIATYNAMTFTGGGSIPASASQYLQVFATSTAVDGLYHAPGQSPIPTNAGKSLNITVAASLLPTQITVNSGLYDVTHPQYPLTASIGVAPRIYQYVSPAANVTDTFTGSIQIYTSNSGFATLFNVVNKTLFQILNAVSGIIISGSYQTQYIQTGTTCYGIIRSNVAPATGSTPGIADNGLVISLNSLVNLNDTNENFQSWTFLESSDYCQMPTQGVNIAYATRDVVSGGLSNLSAPLEIGALLYPSRWNFTVNLPTGLYDHTVTNLEVYRTVDGGSSYLFEQVLLYQNSTLYTTNFNLTDAGLNDQLIGPIDEENDPPPPGLRNIVSHSGRLWGILDNRVYYSGGPDTTNGNGDEAWPPGNNFLFPGSAIDLKSTDNGLIVALTDDLHVITGVDSSSYYAKPWLKGFGISAATAWTRDGQTLYIYTTTQQLRAIMSDGEVREIGLNIGDQLALLFPPQTTSVTFHRSTANDTALYVSNGGGSGSSIFRYDPAKRAWSPRHQPQSFTTGRVKSLETATGVQSLLNSSTTGVFVRDLNVFSDNGVPFPAFVTVGTMTVAPLGERVTLNNVAAYLTTAGALPQMWILLNEIQASDTAPFMQVFNPVNDPPNAPASVSLYAKRWYVESTIAPFRTGTALVNLVSVKLVFSPTGTTKDELLTLTLRDSI
jgi:hypothetical protein